MPPTHPAMGRPDMQRRDFLRTAAVVPVALQAAALRAKSCIFLVLTGGPSQLDTWDPKPDAPTDIRGPFRPIRTNISGMQISEVFPRMARHADKYALIRSVYSDSSATHEDALRTIDLATANYAMLPGPVGFMGSRPALRDAKPASRTFAENCLLAARRVEAGARLVRVNMFETIFHRATWDSHGSRPFSTIADYRNTVAPAFDLGFTTLLEHLSQRGLLSTTLVVAAGEFGRSPRINPTGGRDHWTQCRTVLMAGGGIQGGQIYGSSDAMGAEPKDNPVGFERILATMNHALDLPTAAEPIHQLFV